MRLKVAWSVRNFVDHEDAAQAQEEDEGAVETRGYDSLVAGCQGSV